MGERWGGVKRVTFLLLVPKLQLGNPTFRPSSAWAPLIPLWKKGDLGGFELRHGKTYGPLKSIFSQVALLAIGITFRTPNSLNRSGIFALQRTETGRAFGVTEVSISDTPAIASGTKAVHLPQNRGLKRQANGKTRYHNDIMEQSGRYLTAIVPGTGTLQGCKLH
jgi:hypothetical protein